MNVEQLEAEEIDSRPRLVITRESFMVFGEKGKTLTFDVEQLQCVLKLMRGLGNSCLQDRDLDSLDLE